MSLIPSQNGSSFFDDTFAAFFCQAAFFTQVLSE